MNNYGAQNMVACLKKVLMKRPQKFMSKVDLQKWNYTSPLDQDFINENYNEFYKIIKNSGAEIVDLKLINENAELCDSIFTHDPSLVLKEGAIILNMGKKLRRKETEEHINFYNKEQIPIINTSQNARYPIMGSSYQPRGGVARHDGVAWGFARAAAMLGVDIIQDCEVVGIEVEEGRVKGVKTTRGDIMADRIGCVSAGHSSVLAKMAGLRLPIESHPLQAFVSEAMKPVLHTVVMSNAVHGYISQSDKGDLVIGAGIDGYSSYAQRGASRVIEHSAAAILEMFPIFSRVRMNRQWGGIVDVCPDACPIISPTKVQGLYFNCGWGTGGFKATPGSGHVFAHTIAQDKQHPLAVPFHLDRFTTGALIDEHGAAGVAH